MDKEEKAEVVREVLKEMEKVTRLVHSRMRASFDQMGAQLIEVAPVMGLFHKALVAAGLEREEALELVKTWLQVQLMRSK